jgi:hypothetical protein
MVKQSPFERMIKQVSQPCRGTVRKPPKGSPCRNCEYWTGTPCVGICYRELLLSERKEAATLGQVGPKLKLMEMCGADPRELTRIERAAIRNLVMFMCANYGPEYVCLPLECSCYMLGKCWAGAYCRYFQNAVLPLNSILETALTGSDGTAVQKICPVCGTA